ncbi:putative zinc finger CCCH domain-containing protein 33 [Iris pallida]|uniref:Zinc finger CCCH domain-containing protein 33 n=1 Tax=Iris pallida TaxID=29817 RepID=A0AAX6EHC2_IRIPA|nr:putative zinc finger CCCH domain-containing protein 33 [Iris pallida]
MCNGPRTPLSSSSSSSSIDLLLELSASDDVSAIKFFNIGDQVIDSSGVWYCRSVGPGRRMGLHDRTPLMVAALYGSVSVLELLLSNPSVDVNRRSASDGATALHLAASGGSARALDAVRMLVDASADLDALDASGLRAADVIAKNLLSVGRALEVVLKADPSRASSPEPTPTQSTAAAPATPGAGGDIKKEYPPDLTLPDIKNGIYGTDEFRMYTFKVKPCSRAYSHDWTECPFVHPGENARRRDPRKYLYSCVPCPEFRKGSCRNGDGCEYAHGVFECWLHPAQYRTRLCKDEVGCNRRVCFFAHKREELRSVNPTAASVGGGLVLPSPRSSGVSPLDMATAALLMSSPSSMSPLAAAAVSAGMGSAWMNQVPNLQLPASRLKAASMNSRDRFDLDLDLMGLEGYQQKLLDEISSAASPRSNWPTTPNSLAAASRASDYSNLLGSLEPTARSQLLAGYANNLPLSPTMKSSSSSFGLDHSMAKAIMMNSRSAAFAKRSQSFCDRGAVARQPSVLSPATGGGAGMGIAEWGSRDGKLDWGIHGEELNKFRKSASFAYRSSSNNRGSVSPPKPETAVSEDDPDLSWVQSLVKDGPAAAAAPDGRGGFGQQQPKQYQMNGSAIKELNPWGEQMSALA